MRPQFFKRRTDRTRVSPGYLGLALVSGDIPASYFVCIHSLPQILAVARDSVQWNNNEVG